VPQSSNASQTWPPRLHFRVPLEPSRLLRARDRLRDYLQGYCQEAELIDDVVLCIDEACTNAIRHSGASDDVDVSLGFTDGHLVALVKDTGHGFDVAGFDPSAAPDPALDRGRGLFIMARLMDNVELRCDGGLEVRMTRRASPSRADPPLESGLGEPGSAVRGDYGETRQRAMLEEIDEAFVALDWEYRYLHVNDVALRMASSSGLVSRDELLGHTPFELFPSLAGTGVERQYRDAMELGTPSVSERWSPVTGDWLETRVYPTRAGISVFMREINERKRVEAERERLIEELSRARLHEQVVVRERFSGALNEISASITSLLDYHDVLDSAVAQVAAAVDAESATMCSLEGEAWVPRYLWNMPAEVLDVPIPRGRAAYAEVAVETKAAVAIDDCETDPRVDLELQREWGVRSVMAVPLVVRREVVGALFFNYHGRAHTFTDLETDFVGRAAAVISSVLENARLYEEQQRIAKTLQENFLHPLPLVEGLDLGVVSQTAYEPELVGGDFSDVFLLAAGRVAVLIGDVAGKGVRAAGLTETVRSTVRAFAAIDSSPAFVLRKTNEALLRYDPDEPHVTAFLCVLDPLTGHASFASAGHPAPIHVGPYSCRPLEVAFGPPLGTFASDYATSHVMLTIEDYLVLYTDGVTEARRGGELFGEGQLLEAVTGMRGRSAQALADGVLEATVAFADKLRDDLQVVTLRLA
jgi:anti-sigma regulatory factor (Ser/Thr protein kinase)